MVSVWGTNANSWRQWPGPKQHLSSVCPWRGAAGWPPDQGWSRCIPQGLRWAAQWAWGAKLRAQVWESIRLIILNNEFTCCPGCSLPYMPSEDCSYRSSSFLKKAGAEGGTITESRSTRTRRVKIGPLWKRKVSRGKQIPALYTLMQDVESIDSATPEPRVCPCGLGAFPWDLLSLRSPLSHQLCWCFPG